MSELRACGCDAKNSVHIVAEETLYGWYCYAVCGECLRQGPHSEDLFESDARSAAIAGWNHRPAEDRLRALLRQAREALLQPSSIVAMGEWEDWWLECRECHGKGPVQNNQLSSVVHREDCEREKLLAAIDAALEDTCSTS